jgi:hypothetical protein
LGQKAPQVCADGAFVSKRLGNSWGSFAMPRPFPTCFSFAVKLQAASGIIFCFCCLGGGGRNWTPQTKSQNVEKQSRARETLPPWTPHAETHPLRHVQEAPFPYAGKTLPKAHPHVAFYRCLGGGGFAPAPLHRRTAGGSRTMMMMMMIHHDESS